MNTQDKDFESRNRIVSDIDCNFFVEAGAGSGKTTMLVNRMVSMIEAGIDISKISAITFTKAAAGEFYARFQKILIERSSSSYVWKDEKKAGQLPCPTDETRARCLEALENIDLCFMGTIDAFCGLLLSEHPTEAKIPSDARIISDDEAMEIFRQQFVKICNKEAGTELEKAAKLFQASVKKGEEVFAKRIKFFMENRNAHINYQAPNIVDFETEFHAEKAEILNALEILKNHPELISATNEASREAEKALPSSYKTLKRNWNYNFADAIGALKKLTGLRIVNEAVTEYPFIANVVEPGGKKGAWQDFTPSKKENLYGRMLELQYSICMDFFVQCVPYLETVMKEKGYMTYFDALLYLRNMLKEDAGKGGVLTQYIYNRHSYFLIDEFQDTNPMQAEIFFYLCATQSKEKWSECVPKKGSLFIVGDPKQSIYRFRAADVASFLRVKKLFENNGGEILSLTRNFRSTKTLCEYFNSTFSELMPEETVNQSKFEAIPLPGDDRGETSGIYTYFAKSGKALFEDPEAADCNRITSIIKKLINHEEFQIKDEKTGLLRKLSAKDIMVITNSKADLAPIMRMLSEENISTRVEGKVSFAENDVLNDIFRIYKAAALNNDRKAIYSALSGRCFGFDDEELMTFRENGGKLSFYRTLPEDEETTKPDVVEVAKAIGVLKSVRDKAAKLSPAALFAEIMESFELYKLENVDEPEVLYYTLELMRNKEKTGELVSLSDGVEFLKTLLAGASDEERCLSLSENKDSVHLANLHKIKGLEAPVVILAACSKKVYGDNDITTYIEHNGDFPEAYLIKAGEKNDNFAFLTDFATEAFKDQIEKEKNALNAEVDRQLYVAATRARNILIICRHIGGRGESTRWGAITPADAKDFLEEYDKLPFSEAERKNMLVDGLYEKAESACVLNDRSKEEETYEVSNPSRVHISSKLAANEGETLITGVALDNEDITSATGTASEGDTSLAGEKSAAHKLPALLGTMTHRLMEMLVSTGNTVDSDSAVEAILHEYLPTDKAAFRQALKDALSGVVAKIKAGGYSQENGAPEDILKVLLAAEEVYCEAPFCFREQTSEGVIVWNGIMDVVYRDEKGWHIVDYKTNFENDGLDMKYRGQLQAYMKAFKETTGFDADAKIYHIDI